MAYGLQPTTSYVKFAKGTQAAFDALTTKPDDTLFFVYEDNNSTTGSLWLGNKQIGDGSVATLSELISETVQDGELLVYNETNDTWEPLPIEDIIGEMTGATAQAAGSSGLVPVPQAGDQNKFLRGDGTWVEIAGGNLSIDDNQFTTVNGELSLYGFSTATAGSMPLKAVDGSIEWATPVTEQRVNTLISEASSLGLRRVIISDISEVVSEAYIYLLPKQNGSNGNLYDEYMLINNQVEKIGDGTNSISLDGYVTTSIYQAEVGDLSQLTRASGAPDSTIIDELNDINERLTWQEIVEN